MNELKKVRKSAGISQVTAAKILNISRRTYQKYESLDDKDKKLQFYIYQMREKFLIDEEHGVLKLEDIKNKVGDVFSMYKINFCYLFGPYAKNKANPKSDVDLLIDSEITGLDYFGLVEELREALHKKIDLLKMDQLNNNLDLLREVMKDGIKIYG